MLANKSRLLAKLMLKFFNVETSIQHAERIPLDNRVIVISNHRSFLDAALLLEAMPYSLRIACHHYMGQTLGLKQITSLLNCFPLGSKNQGQEQLFRTAQQLSDNHQWIGLFPEGALPMVEPPSCNQVGNFQRGFAHLAYRLQADNVTILPIAIASLAETKYDTFPIKWLTKLDSSETIFQREGLHPVILYHHVKLLIGNPQHLTLEQKQKYQGKQAKKLVNNLTHYCQQQIAELLREGYAKKGGSLIKKSITN